MIWTRRRALYVSIVLVVALSTSPTVPGLIGGTGSMSPAMGACDIVFIDRTSEVSELEEGDVIVFDAEWTWRVVHRVVETNEASVVPQGDANEHPDHLVTDEELIGTVTTHIETPDPPFVCGPPRTLR